MTRSELAQRDASDKLRHCSDDFYQPDGLIYLDGNSLGMMPKAAMQRMHEMMSQQWGKDLITSWNKHHWIDYPTRIGNRIGGLVGAAQGQVVCCDSISVNLFKVICAALKINTGRNIVISTKDNFPTDLYMIQGIEELLGEQQCHLQLVDEDDLEKAICDTAPDCLAAILITEVNFRTGRKLEIPHLVKTAHQHSALVIVDLAHSVGVLPVQLDDWQVDFAVGCTYKYLNGGPGAPAFVYTAKRLQNKLKQPLYGWMGHISPFEFTPEYEPAKDIKQQLVGTPSIIAMSIVDAALDCFEKVNIQDIRAKSMAMSEVFLRLLSESEHGQQLHCISPLNAEHRGSQLSFEFQYAWALCQALIKEGVVADFRAPNYIRFGFAPLYNSYQQMGKAVQVIDAILADKRYQLAEYQTRQKVT